MFWMVASVFAALRFLLAPEYTWSAAAFVVALSLLLRVRVVATALMERLASLLEDDDGRDAIVANRRLRALKTGMHFMECASHPKSSLRAAKIAVKRMSKRRQILRRTEPGTGLRHLHSRPDREPSAGLQECSYFSDVSDGGVPWRGQIVIPAASEPTACGSRRPRACARPPSGLQPEASARHA